MFFKRFSVLKRSFSCVHKWNSYRSNSCRNGGNTSKLLRVCVCICFVFKGEQSKNSDSRNLHGRAVLCRIIHVYLFINSTWMRAHTYIAVPPESICFNVPNLWWVLCVWCVYLALAWRFSDLHAIWNIHAHWTVAYQIRIHTINYCRLLQITWYILHCREAFNTRFFTNVHCHFDY